MMPMKNQILIRNNDPSTFLNVTSCVENGSVVDTLDVTRNLDVSLDDCTCSAEKVYCFATASATKKTNGWLSDKVLGR